jgi:hypothetical protein
MTVVKERHEVNSEYKRLRIYQIILHFPIYGLQSHLTLTSHPQPEQEHHHSHFSSTC